MKIYSLILIVYSTTLGSIMTALFLRPSLAFLIAALTIVILPFICFLALFLIIRAWKQGEGWATRIVEGPFSELM